MGSHLSALAQVSPLPSGKPDAIYLLTAVTFVWVSAPPREAAVPPPGTHSPRGHPGTTAALCRHPQLRTSGHKEPARRGGGGKEKEEEVIRGSLRRLISAPNARLVGRTRVRASAAGGLRLLQHLRRAAGTGVPGERACLPPGHKCCDAKTERARGGKDVPTAAPVRRGEASQGVRQQAAEAPGSGTSSLWLRRSLLACFRSLL